MVVGLSLCAMSADSSDTSTGGVPVARVTESVICCPGDPVRLDGWASIDVGGEVDAWLWDVTGDGEVDTTCPGGELRMAAPSRPGTHGMYLRVRDNEGNVSGPDTAVLHVMDSPPVVELGPDTTVKIGVRVSLVPRITAHCGTPVLYEWDLDDDGTYEYHSRRHGRTSRVYFRPGTFRVRFRVTDDLDRRGGGIRTIVVSGSHAAE
jgi:hypothetical protein